MRNRRAALSRLANRANLFDDLRQNSLREAPRDGVRTDREYRRRRAARVCLSRPCPGSGARRAARLPAQQVSRAGSRDAGRGDGDRHRPRFRIVEREAGRLYRRHGASAQARRAPERSQMAGRAAFRHSRAASGCREPVTANSRQRRSAISSKVWRARRPSPAKPGRSLTASPIAGCPGTPRNAR